MYNHKQHTVNDFIGFRVLYTYAQNRKKTYNVLVAPSEVSSIEDIK